MSYPDQRYYATFFTKRYKVLRSLSTPIKLNLKENLKRILIVY